MNFLTVAQMQKRISELTYRPGWKMEVVEAAFEGVKFHVFALEPDTTKEGESIPLDIWSNIPPMLSLDHFDAWLSWRLRIIEDHESREWLRVKSTGKALFYPHIPGSDKGRYDIDEFKRYREEYY
jgi:hypothetical protein